MFFKKKKVKVEISDNLRKIKELNETIDFSKYAMPAKNGAIDMPMNDGKAGKAVNLMRNDEIAIAHTCFPDGGKFPVHSHAEFECILVYRGEITFNYGNKTKTLKPTDSICFDPYTPHMATIKPNTKVIAVTMPPSPDWPEGGGNDDR